MLVLPLPFRGRNTGRVGFAAALAGGALILVEGLLSSSPVLAQFGEFALVAGGAIIACALISSSQGRIRPVLGGLIVLLSLASLFGFSGYLLGAFLGSLGGTLIVLTPGFSASSYRGRGQAGKIDLGPPCPTCGKPVPPWTSTCPYCGNTG